MGKRLYGIKREKLPESEKGGKRCKDCRKGITYTIYDYQMDALITRCQFCPIVRIDQNKELYANFRNGLQIWKNVNIAVVIMFMICGVTVSVILRITDKELYAIPISIYYYRYITIGMNKTIMKCDHDLNQYMIGTRKKSQYCDGCKDILRACGA